MAQQQNNINVIAPGFKGLNTQDAPVGMDIAFASIADNCVIDKFGRIAVRKGFAGVTDNPSVLAGSPLETSFVFQSDNGTDYLLAAGGNKIWLQTAGVLTELALPVDYPGITDNNWQFCQLNNVCYMVQEGHNPLKFAESAPGADDWALLDWTETPDDIPILPTTPVDPDLSQPNCVTAGFGRLWCGDFTGEKSYITWSNLLDGDGYALADPVEPTSGYFDLEEYWPFGYDECVAIRVHNDFLIVWGKQSMLVYQIDEAGPAEVGTRLVDTIEGIGCAGRDSVQPTGKDVMFLDYTGVRLLSRTIQEKSIPIGDVSINVRDEIQQEIETTVNRTIRSVYDPDNMFYAVFFPNTSNSTAYVFDIRTQLENGAFRATRWPDIDVLSGGRAPDGATWFTGVHGFYVYSGYSDTYTDPVDDVTQKVEAIPMVYQTHPQTFGEPVSLKFPKQVDITVVGGRDFDLCLDWAYDYTNKFNGFCKRIIRGTAWEFNTTDPLTEFNTVAEFSGGLEDLSFEQYNVWGNGRNVRYRFTADVTAEQLSFQEINIQATMGRII